MKKILLPLIIASMALTGCSLFSNKAKREIVKQYVVIDAQYEEIPSWIDDPDDNDDDKTVKAKNAYFVSESENVANKRLCVKSAKARAYSEIAAQMTTVIKNEYQERTSDNNGQQVSSEKLEQLQQEIMSMIVGAKVISTYWEQRHYKTELGADEDTKSYTCNALIRMPKAELEKAIKRAAKKLELQSQAE